MKRQLYRYRLKIFSLVLLVMLQYTTVQAVPVSLNITDAPVRDVLLSLAKLNDANLLVDDSVSGRITLQLDNVEIETALELIVKAKGLFCHAEAGAMVVSANDVVQKSFAKLHTFRLQYIEPKTAQAAAAGLLADAAIGAFPKSAAASNTDFAVNKQNAADSAVKKPEIKYNDSIRLNVDVTTNTLFFFGTAKEALLISQLLKSIDIPSKQISLEAKIVAIEKNAAKNLGIEWAWSALPQYPEHSRETEATSHRIIDADGKVTIVTEQLPKESIERQSGLAEKMGGIIQFGRGPEGYPFEAYYSAKLNALLTDGKASILARPNITTLNGHEALINIGGSVPVPTTAVTNSTTTTSLEYRDAGIILRYTPRVNDAGFITAAVQTEVSTPVYVADVKAYRFNRRSAQTMVRLVDGETMVIGGLIGAEESRSISKIPLLGDLPILGRFFSNIKNGKNESEIMIFLTAHIVD